MLTVFCGAQNVDSIRAVYKNAANDTVKYRALSHLVEMTGDDEWPALNDELIRVGESRIKASSGVVLNFFQ